MIQACIAGSHPKQFDAEGRIVRYDAEAKATANQRFHGAGKYAKRESYKLIGGYMVPTQFEIARVMDGQIKPF